MSTLTNISNTNISNTSISKKPIVKFHFFSCKPMSAQKRISMLVRLSCLVFLVVLFTIIWNL